jgi:phosphatidylserine/phosphatidylglycerophosphate/cardiolipin synthase-like enzyme
MTMNRKPTGTLPWLLATGACLGWLGWGEGRGSSFADVVQEKPIEVFFSPRAGCTAAVVREIDNATESISIQAYSFTSTPIAKAIVLAHRRGVKVAAILDRSQRTARYSSATYLSNANVPVFIDAAHAIAHNKIIIIDGKTVITGSFNFTKQAEEKNAENLLIVRDPEIAAQYTANWERHSKHSPAYERIERKQ